MLRTLLYAAVLAVAATGMTSADEVFKARDLSSGDPLPDIFYETDAEDSAVFAFQDLSARFYINDLTYPGRTMYEGKYVVYEVDGPGCSETVADHTGREVTHWGKLLIAFSSDSGFVMFAGECDGEIDTSEGIAGVWPN